MPTSNNKRLPPHETPSTPIHAAISSTSAGTGTPSTSTKNDSLNTQAKSVREQPWGVRASSR